MRILLTGFGPFPGVPRNPTTLLVEHLARSGCGIPGVDLSTTVLPVTYAACTAWAESVFGAQQFDGILHLGVAATASEFRVEAVARNRCSLISPDAAGELWPDVCILPDGPDEYHSPCSVPQLAEALRGDDIPTTVSTDAGDYLCNLLYYHSLHRARRFGLDLPIVFLHVPPALETDPFPRNSAAHPMTVHQRAVSCMLTELLAHSS